MYLSLNKLQRYGKKNCPNFFYIQEVSQKRPLKINRNITSNNPLLYKKSGGN